MNQYVVPEGMPLSVFNDRYSRKVNGVLQTYAERALEMANGNLLLDHNVSQQEAEDFRQFTVAGIVPMSGRHLQHGDATQPNRPIEVFTNCSTSPFSFLNFYLLLNGSGVGRDYSSESCRVDWDYMPNVRLVLDGGYDDDGVVSPNATQTPQGFDTAGGAHPDYISATNEFKGMFDSLREARHKYDSDSEDVRWIKVRDSREGWAEVIAILETAAFHRNHKDSLFIFDFSAVRPKGSVIVGMQSRPAQGPLPLMRAIAKVCTIKGVKMKPWKQALFIDHYLASCVVMGNVRRAARMATKWWGDRDIIEFIDIKRGGYLWSANNSITVDEEFWAKASNPRPSHARRVLEAAAGAAYHDGTGEPGFINVHLLNNNISGFDKINSSNYLSPHCDLRLHPKTYSMIENVLVVLKNSKFPFITNPCGEIVLSKFGGYCVIGDVVLARVTSLDEARKAVGLTAKALVRTNLMPALFQTEVDRTNRIGVGLTGIFEFAWKLYELSFRDLIAPYEYFFDSDTIADMDQETLTSAKFQKAVQFWNDIASLRTTVETEAAAYSTSLGRSIPHTFTTIKPSGTISKVMGCTEGAHLPPYAFYVRWVITEKGSEKHADYLKRGYPVKDVSHQYEGCVVVGFPTKHPITDFIPPEHVVTASDVTPVEQYKWLKLLEHFWIGPMNNQVSYTMKYDPKSITSDQFLNMLLQWQQTVKCCSVMPFTDESAYAYVPEQECDMDTYLSYMSKIDRAKTEDYDEESIMCPGGACPIEGIING